ncbi:hypothetical protein WG66_010900 [Moniliophthora roreri]|nr:hypothetical protein WG66_010900 [Moniliophthora roreri]
MVREHVTILMNPIRETYWRTTINIRSDIDACFASEVPEGSNVELVTSYPSSPERGLFMIIRTADTDTAPATPGVPRTPPTASFCTSTTLLETCKKEFIFRP